MSQWVKSMRPERKAANLHSDPRGSPLPRDLARRKQTSATFLVAGMWGLPFICQPSSEGDDGLSGSQDTGTSVLKKTCVSREPTGPESLGSTGKTWAGMALGRPGGGSP